MIPDHYGGNIMEHFELVEKLVTTFGVSYEKAKEALEYSNWDPIDAAIYLEREKNGQPQPERTEIPQEPKQESAAEEPKAGVNTGTKGSYSIPVDDWKKEGSKFVGTIWDFLTKNTFVVKKSTGEVFLDIPTWLFASLLCCFFWAIVMIMVIVFIMGYRFSFSGPHLNKQKVKNTVDKMSSVTDEFVSRVKNAVAPDKVETVDTPEAQPEIKLDTDSNETPAEESAAEETPAEESPDQTEEQ